jgi:hypothetical protein
MKINMFDIVGDFGEDKDAAAALREADIRPSIRKGQRVCLDFDGVTLVTQSFIHALISDVLRTTGEAALELLEFENCANVVRGIISTVVQYSLDSMLASASLAEEEPRRQKSNQPMRLNGKKKNVKGKAAKVRHTKSRRK